MSARWITLLAVGATTAFLCTASAPLAAAEERPASPKVEVVFCLDTTGSMGGLIQAAKDKIWAICNQIAGGKPTPELRVGLVAYRDRGDAYVTRLFDLTDDLDAVHANLKGFQAQGGGDTPESVNQALYEAVHKIKWSRDANTLRIIFLVGDAPPHMDYPDDVKYPETCRAACEKAIIINSIQCGNLPGTQQVWKDICTKAEGSYVQIAQNGGPVVTIETPFDKRLAEINAELARSTLTFGDARKQQADRRKADDAVRSLPPALQAERAAANAKLGGRAASYDLLDNLKNGKLRLEELKDDELPDELKKLTLEERKAYLKKLEERRAALSKEALELDKQRSDYIAQKQAEQKQTGKDSFDGQVLDLLRNQARRVKIEY